MINLAKTKELLLPQIDPLKFYRKYFPDWDGRSNVSCLFHSDVNPSFAINVKNGKCKCYSANCREGKFGSIVHFYERYHKTDEENAILTLCKKYKVSPVPAVDEDTVVKVKHIEFWNDRLSTNLAIQDHLEKLRGITLDTIRDYLLGFNPATNRITIPCFDTNLKLANVRQYLLDRSKTVGHRPKMLSLRNDQGGDSQLLYPEWKLKRGKGILILFGGEFDCLLARQHGFNGVTSLAGESAWNDKWVKWFEEKDVWICLDQDEAGKAAAKKIKEKLAAHGIKSKRLLLPFRRPALHKDFTDWVIHEGNNADGLAHYLKEQGPLEEEEMGIPERRTLTQALDSRNYEKASEIPCVVAGKSDAPYMVPTRVKFVCAGTNAHCPVCAADDATLEMRIPRWSRKILEFVNRKDKQCEMILLNLAKIPKKCRPEIQILERAALHEVWVGPDIGIMEDTMQNLQKCFYTGDKIDDNRSYKMTARLVSEIDTQKSVLLINKSEPSESAIESFKLSASEKKLLTCMQPKQFTDAAVSNKLKEIAMDHAACCTGIKNRVDLHLAAMLTYHSALEFYFDSKTLTRGWFNTLIIGDTGSGKSKVAEQLRLLYHAGQVISGENCSFMGLVGGIYNRSNQMSMVRWGKIPMNDKGLLTIEEFGSMTLEDISRLTDVRSSGIARIDKFGFDRKVFARTRLLCLSNTRGGKNLHSFPSGAHAILGLVGTAEDIRRFDVVLTTRNAEVDTRVINTWEKVHKTSAYHPDVHRLLVAWAWSRHADQIVFDDDAIEMAMKWAITMGNDFHAEIPIFKAEDGRYKLARIAVAAAAQTFSTSDGEVLHVKCCHVLYAVRYLYALYTKPSLGYWTQSKLAYQKEQLGNLDAIANILEKVEEKYYKNTISMFLTSPYVTQMDVSASAGVEEWEGRDIIKLLVAERALIAEGRLGWIVTPPFRDWLHQNHNVENEGL